MTDSNPNLVTVDPAWPWSIGSAGLEALAVVAVALVALTVWTYLGVRGATGKRIAILIGLRLAALAIACLAVLRPSLAFRDEPNVPTSLILAADYSQSMTVQDQHKNQSRWETLQRLLVDCQPELQELRDKHNISVFLYRFAGDVGEYDAKGKAEGKRTDFGEMLNVLYDRHGSDRYLRGLLILSDGADNGTRYPALSLATKWRALSCPIHTFAFGQTTTSTAQHDIALTGIAPEPSPVATKGKLTVRGTVDAPGFEHNTVRVRLFIDDKEILAKDEKLPRTAGNEVRLVCDAPEKPGEIKVTLKIDPLPGEVTAVNNEISTYLTVTKEGLSVLYVEGKYRAWEPKFIRYALSQDPSIRLFEAVRLTDQPSAGESDLFQFEKQHYDVIILGDITAKRLSGGEPAVLEAVRKQVYEKGAGLMMMGGYESFGNSDWNNTPLASLLPVELNVSGQVDGPVQMNPTAEGLRHYVMRLADSEADNTAIWNQLPNLDGMTRLGRPKPQSFVLAQSSSSEAVLVGQIAYGAGRTLAFAGDTTWRWCRTEDGSRAHNRFWRRLVLWLAKRDEAEGNILIVPDMRRLAAGGKLGFAVKLKGKSGLEIPAKNAQFEVAAIGPDHVESRIPTAEDRGEQRGTFWKTDQPGEYTLVAKASGTDVDGKPLVNLQPARIRFIVYQDDSEMARQAADHDFLNKLANAGGGKFHAADHLRQFLKDVANLPLAHNYAKAKIWPNWRRNPASSSANDQLSALLESGILPIFLLFITVLSLEWILRRSWGFV